MPVATETESWFFLSRVGVIASEDTGVVVAIGNSITDGYGATVDANSRWPDHLVRRFHEADLDMASPTLALVEIGEWATVAG